MPEIIRITSEALQATIRRLLPSQQGFGDDLQASNVITPIIDLTPTAEGSQLPYQLQTALAFGSQTAVNASNNTVTLASTPGFYRIYGAINITSTNQFVHVTLSDGLSSKILLQAGGVTGTDSYTVIDFNVFLDTGDSITATSSGANAFFRGSSRQIADRYGNVVNPNGFTFE